MVGAWLRDDAGNLGGEPQAVSLSAGPSPDEALISLSSPHE
jgi:hypothetical protein